MTSGLTPKRILIMAGGTGGHVFPAIAVAKELANQGWEILWLGTAERMEAKVVPQNGFNIQFIDIKGVRGNGLMRKLAAPFKVLRSIIQAKSVISSFKPDVVLGMGGFASGPGGVAAKLSGVPLVLHEQNAIPGMTNKLLSRIADKVLCAFENTFVNRADTQVVGNPIRQELLQLNSRNAQAEDGALRVLVVGGSLGARVFNQLLPVVSAELRLSHPITVWHQVGRGNTESVLNDYKEQNLDNMVQVAEFIDDMEAAYSWADVVICRSGALTVSELAVVGKASILVPYPHAVDDHQTLNAQVLVDAGAAFLVPQPIATAEVISEKLAMLAQDRNELAQMGQKAKQVAVLEAANNVAQVCKELAG
ncbi:MAG: undecaprenyldiphospho-muramoylpentapeptide beta-N-acetylglucosaminyltransferase [Parashewanella sp.]